MSKYYIGAFFSFLLVLSGTACGQNPQSDSKTKPANSMNNCQPLETSAPNAEEQKPTFPEQTRACGVRNENRLRSCGRGKRFEQTLGGQSLCRTAIF